MNLFSEKLKESNTARIVMLIAFTITWIYIVGEDSFSGVGNSYVYRNSKVHIVIGFVFITILLGEISRKIIRLFAKEKTKGLIVNGQISKRAVEKKRDIEALNLSIVWSTIFIILASIL